MSAFLKAPEKGIAAAQQIFGNAPLSGRQILSVDDRIDGTVGAQIGDREIVVSTDAQDAMRRLASGRIDAVIANLRDVQESISLLEKVAASNPALPCFLRADSHEVNPAIIAQHSILPRTWNMAIMEDAINRSFALVHWKANPALVALIGHIHKIPTLPSLYTEIAIALQKEDCLAEEIAHLIAKDPGITAKLLQFVNSSYMALNRRVADPVEAVMFFGTRKLRTLILMSSMFARFDGAKCSAFSLAHFSKYSLEVASWSSTIAAGKFQDEQLADMCFTAGLLHDFGILLLASSFPDRYNNVLHISKQRRTSPDSAELETFGVTHAELGGFILSTWSLPFPIISAVGLHHDPSRSQDMAFSPLTAVHIATAVNGFARTGVLTYDHDYIERLGLSGSVEHWAKRLVGEKKAG